MATSLGVIYAEIHLQLGDLTSEGSIADEIFSSLQDAAAAFSDSMLALSDQLDAATASFADLSASAADASAALDEVAVSADAADASVNTAGDSAALTGQMFSKMAMPLTIALALVAGTAIASVKMAADFQSSITELQTGAGELPQNLKLVSDGILNMAGQVGVSVGQLTDGMFMIESAGYKGAAGLAVLKAAAEGARVGNADLGVVADATTTILNDYGKSGVTAANAVNTLLLTVASGKTHLQDLAAALSQVLPTASAAHIKLTDVMAAMATMTSEGVPAANAATYLRQTLIALEAPGGAAQKALASVGLTTDKVAAAMKTSLPSAIKMIVDAVNAHFKPGSAEWLAAIKAISGGSKTMQGMLDLSGDHLKTFADDAKNMGSKVKQSGDTIQGWAETQKDFNTKMAQAGATLQVAMIRLGQAILPLATRLIDKLQPALTNMGNWIAGHGQQAAIILGILAAVIGGALVVALGAAAIALVAAAAPALPFIAAGAALAGIAVLIALNWGKVQHALAPVVQAFQKAAALFSPIANELRSQLGGVLAQLGTTLRTQLLPAWNALKPALEALKPVLTVIGVIIGSMLIILIGWLVGLITGLIRGLGSLLTGMIEFGSGIIRAVIGMGQVLLSFWGGIFAVIGDIIHGNFGKIIPDILTAFRNMGAGIQNILGGLWSAIQGLIQGTIGTILALISGLVSGVVGFFQNLFDTIVGHSIVPDLITNIIKFFTQLPGKVLSLIEGMISSLVASFLNMSVRLLATIITFEVRAIEEFLNLQKKIAAIFLALPAQALQWGIALIQGFISGIKNMAGAVKNAASGIVSGVKNILGFHSPAKEGPGSDADTWAPALVNMFAGGLLAGQSKIQSGATQLASALKLGLVGGSAASALAAAGSGSPGALNAASGALGNGNTTINLTVEVQAGPDDGDPATAGAMFGRSAGSALSLALAQRGYYGNK